MVHVQMDGRPMVAPTTMLVRKLFDKPEFEGLVRVLMGGPSRTPVPTIHQYRPTDKPEFTLSLFKVFWECRGQAFDIFGFAFRRSWCEIAEAKLLFSLFSH